MPSRCALPVTNAKKEARMDIYFYDKNTRLARLIPLPLLFAPVATVAATLAASLVGGIPPDLIKLLVLLTALMIVVAMCLYLLASTRIRIDRSQAKAWRFWTLLGGLRAMESEL